MCDKVHTPMFKKIDFKADMKSCNGHVSIPGVVEVKTEAIRNPVTGQDRKSTRLNSSHIQKSRMPSSA